MLNFGWKSKDFCDIEEYWETLIFRACFIWAWNESQSWYWSCCLIHSLANHCQLEKPHYEIFPKQSFNPTFSQVLEASLFSTCHFSSKSWNLIFSKKWKDLLCDTLHVFSCDSSVYVHCTHSQKGYTCVCGHDGGGLGKGELYHDQHPINAFLSFVIELFGYLHQQVNFFFVDVLTWHD